RAKPAVTQPYASCAMSNCGTKYNIDQVWKPNIPVMRISNNCNCEGAMITNASSDAATSVQSLETREDLVAAIRDAQAQGKPFVLGFQTFSGASRSYDHEEHECGCGCGPAD